MQQNNPPSLLKILFRTKESAPKTIGPANISDAETNFIIIKKLITLPGSQHTIKGDAGRFTIQQYTYFYIFSLLAAICSANLFYYGISAIATNYTHGYYWFVGSILVSAGMYILITVSPAKAYFSLTVDRSNNTLSVRHHDLLRRYFTPKKTIHFSDVKDIYSRQISIKGRGQRSRIYVTHHDSASVILALPFGDETFMDSLMSIINSSVQSSHKSATCS